MTNFFPTDDRNVASSQLKVRSSFSNVSLSLLVEAAMTRVASFSNQ